MSRTNGGWRLKFLDLNATVVGLHVDCGTGSARSLDHDPQGNPPGTGKRGPAGERDLPADGVRQNLPTPATLPRSPRRSRARRYHPRGRRAAGSLLAYIPGLILARAEGPGRRDRACIVVSRVWRAFHGVCRRLLFRRARNRRGWWPRERGTLAAAV